MIRVLDEAWGVLPTGLREWDSVDGSPVYSSLDLQNKYVEAISNQKILSPVIKAIKAHVTNGRIIPCFANKNMMGLLFHKMFANSIDKATMGYYHPGNNKVYIIMDNRTKYLVWMSNQKLSTVTIHEMMHYAAKNYKRMFFNQFKDILGAFYSDFFSTLSGHAISPSTGSKAALYLLENFEWKQATTQSIFNYAHHLDEIVSIEIPDKDEREKFIISLISPAKIFMNDPNVFIRSLQRDDEIVNYVRGLYTSYKRLGIKSPDTTPIQEILFPSEVVAITSERPTRKHYVAVNTVR